MILEKFLQPKPSPIVQALGKGIVRTADGKIWVQQSHCWHIQGVTASLVDGQIVPD